VGPVGSKRILVNAQNGGECNNGSFSKERRGVGQTQAKRAGVFSKTKKDVPIRQLKTRGVGHKYFGNLGRVGKGGGGCRGEESSPIRSHE